MTPITMNLTRSPLGTAYTCPSQFTPGSVLVFTNALLYTLNAATPEMLSAPQLQLVIVPAAPDTTAPLRFAPVDSRGTRIAISHSGNPTIELSHSLVHEFRQHFGWNDSPRSVRANVTLVPLVQAPEVPTPAPEKEQAPAPRINDIIVYANHERSHWYPRGGDFSLCRSGLLHFINAEDLEKGADLRIEFTADVSLVDTSAGWNIVTSGGSTILKGREAAIELTYGTRDHLRSHGIRNGRNFAIRVTPVGAVETPAPADVVAPAPAEVAAPAAPQLHGGLPLAEFTHFQVTLRPEVGHIGYWQIEGSLASFCIDGLTQFMPGVNFDDVASITIDVAPGVVTGWTQVAWTGPETDGVINTVPSLPRGGFGLTSDASRFIHSRIPRNQVFSLNLTPVLKDLAVSDETPTETPAETPVRVEIRMQYVSDRDSAVFGTHASPTDGSCPFAQFTLCPGGVSDAFGSAFGSRTAPWLLQVSTVNPDDSGWVEINRYDEASVCLGYDGDDEDDEDGDNVVDLCEAACEIMDAMNIASGETFWIRAIAIDPDVPTEPTPTEPTPTEPTPTEPTPTEPTPTFDPVTVVLNWDSRIPGWQIGGYTVGLNLVDELNGERAVRGVDISMVFESAERGAGRLFQLGDNYQLTGPLGSLQILPEIYGYLQANFGNRFYVTTSQNLEALAARIGRIPTPNGFTLFGRGLIPGFVLSRDRGDVAFYHIANDAWQIGVVGLGADEWYAVRVDSTLGRSLARAGVAPPAVETADVRQTLPQVPQDFVFVGKGVISEYRNEDRRDVAFYENGMTDWVIGVVGTYPQEFYSVRAGSRLHRVLFGSGGQAAQVVTPVQPVTPTPQNTAPPEGFAFYGQGPVSLHSHIPNKDYEANIAYWNRSYREWRIGVRQLNCTDYFCVRRDSDTYRMLWNDRGTLEFSTFNNPGPQNRIIPRAQTVYPWMTDVFGWHEGMWREGSHRPGMLKAVRAGTLTDFALKASLGNVDRMSFELHSRPGTASFESVATSVFGFRFILCGAANRLFRLPEGTQRFTVEFSRHLPEDDGWYKCSFNPTEGWCWILGVTVSVNLTSEIILTLISLGINDPGQSFWLRVSVPALPEPAKPEPSSEPDVPVELLNESTPPSGFRIWGYGLIAGMTETDHKDGANVLYWSPTARQWQPCTEDYDAYEHVLAVRAGSLAARRATERRADALTALGRTGDSLKFGRALDDSGVTVNWVSTSVGTELRLCAQGVKELLHMDGERIAEFRIRVWRSAPPAAASRAIHIRREPGYTDWMLRKADGSTQPLAFFDAIRAWLNLIGYSECWLTLASAQPIASSGPKTEVVALEHRAASSIWRGRSVSGTTVDLCTTDMRRLMGISPSDASVVELTVSPDSLASNCYISNWSANNGYVDLHTPTQSQRVQLDSGVTRWLSSLGYADGARVHFRFNRVP